MTQKRLSTAERRLKRIFRRQGKKQKPQAEIIYRFAQASMPELDKMGE